LPFTGFRVDPLVVHAWSDHRHRTGAGQHLPRIVIAVAHHQTMAVLVTHVGEAGDIGVDLGPPRLGQPPTGALADDLVDQRRRSRRRRISGLITVDGIRDYGEHRDIPSRPALPAPA
jgi:hypothetical protein